MTPRRKFSAHPERGAVLVETALVTGMVLTLLLFSVQVGILGFLQITADAASFVDAHVHSTGTVSKTANIESATAGSFPQLAPGDISTTPLPAPSASIPVDYQYNGTKSQIAQSQNIGGRVGGVSMLQPTLIQSNVKPHQVFSMFGNDIGVTGQDVEPQWEECGAHYNVVNASNLTCGGSSPTSNFQVDYFSQGENTPPYFVGFNYIKHCQDQQPWTTCSGSGSGAGVDFIAFGVAEYLDAPNSSRGQPGISGDCDQATFYEAAYHQRTYSDLASFFNRYSDLLKLYEAYGGAGDTQNNTIFKAISGNAPVSDFARWNEFGQSAIPDSGAGQKADTDIQTIYGWDAHVQEGYTYTSKADPGQYPLHPDGGCS
ncbi:MAG: pilus assembly protein [Candidatus Eremiobacteraeota bacterium]|nr:pilus assembly protein [Candidatus Eremiobacteraeota bacterium]